MTITRFPIGKIAKFITYLVLKGVFLPWKRRVYREFGKIVPQFYRENDENLAKL